MLSHDVIRRLIAFGLTDIGIDVAKHLVNRFLSEGVKTLAFRQNITNQLVIAFAGGLIGCFVRVSKITVAYLFPILAYLNFVKG